MNYRQPDIWPTTLLAHLLAERFGREEVFLAGRSIPPGVDFDKVLLAAAAGAKVMVVMMGVRWEASLREYAADQGQPHWVTREIQAAQAHDVRLLPVRLTDEPRPTAGGLPEGIDPSLIDIVRAPFRPKSYERDAQTIAEAIGRLAPELSGPETGTPPPEIST